MPTVRYTNFRGIAPRLRNDDARMQVTAKGGPFQRQLHDAYLTSDGQAVAMPSMQSVLEHSNVLNAQSTATGLYVHAGNEMIRNPHLNGGSVVVASLDAARPVAWHDFANWTWWTDGAGTGRIDAAGQNWPWALPQAPPPTVTPAGGLLTGRYLVSVTYLDESGQQGGCAESTVVECSGHGLVVAEPEIPSGCVARLWVSQANDPLPMFVGDYGAADFPVLISSEPADSAVLRTQGLAPMPAGEGVHSCGDFLLTWWGDVLSFSALGWPGLHNPSRDYFQFPASIRGAVGLPGGVWVATEQGMYWVAGSDLRQAGVMGPLDVRTYAKGGKRLLEPAGQMQPPMALFVSSSGLVVGTADGRLMAPQEPHMRLDCAAGTMTGGVWQQPGARLLVCTGGRL